ncbi:MAG: MepB family protein [Rhizobacter sp.]|nr:MepB family protein [Ferruginibacter sp.]
MITQDLDILKDTAFFLFKEWVQNKCRLVVSDIIESEESKAYAACTFQVNDANIIYRQSKITPTKTGQFVTIWKRNKAGITEAFCSTDNFDYLTIVARSGLNIGAFIFPKNVLLENGIIGINGKDGKRGIRIYPPWDVAANKQAVKTQQWQKEYFIDLKDEENTTAGRVSKILSGV